MTSPRSLLLLALAVSSLASQQPASYSCEVLKRTYPNITYLPEDVGYAKENQSQSNFQNCR
jgi:hypothetical protein